MLSVRSTLQVVGHKEGLDVMERADPLFLLIGLPTIPVMLILGKMIRWEDYVLRLWRKYSNKLQILNSIFPGQKISYPKMFSFVFMLLLTVGRLEHGPYVYLHVYLNDRCPCRDWLPSSSYPSRGQPLGRPRVGHEDPVWCSSFPHHCHHRGKAHVQ